MGDGEQARIIAKGILWSFLQGHAQPAEGGLVVYAMAGIVKTVVTTVGLPDRV